MSKVQTANPLCTALAGTCVSRLNQTHTENGAVSNQIIDPTGKYEGRLGLLYKAVRDVDINIFDQYLIKAIDENIVDACVLAYQLRDCRGGKGERDLGRYALIKLFNTITDQKIINQLINLVVEYGRWDDLVIISNKVNTNIKISIYEYIWTHLKLDKSIMDINQVGVSLCAKWLPTEKHALDKKTNFVKLFTQMHNISISDYRKKYLAPLRKYINIVERLICSNNWSLIDYNKVPSCSMYKLKNAFKKHDPTRFDEWAQLLKSGATKVNAGQLFPHEIIYSVQNNNNIDPTLNSLFEAQFSELIKKYSENGLFDHTLVVCDVSGSMDMFGNGANSPINVCIGLGILIASLTKEPFLGKIITFSNEPTYVDLSKLYSLYDKLNCLKHAEWSMNTDLQKVFDLVLNTAINAKVNNCDMPQRIIIISDMQFDQANGNDHISNFSLLSQKYLQFGYTIPRIIFWNVNGKYSDFPITITDNAILISGFSPSVLKYIFEDKIVSPIDLLNEVLHVERYLPIRNAFK